MTARPFVPATRVVRRFSQEIISTTCKGYRLYRDLEAIIINTELQYHVRLKHLAICLFLTAKSSSTPHSPVFLSRCS